MLLLPKPTFWPKGFPVTFIRDMDRPYTDIDQEDTIYYMAGRGCPVRVAKRIAQCLLYSGRYDTHMRYTMHYEIACDITKKLASVGVVMLFARKTIFGYKPEGRVALKD